jgi:cysteine sulfinate desulfinase/cysteine desulfurase-like protein
MNRSQARSGCREVEGVREFLKSRTICVSTAHPNREYGFNAILLTIALFLFGGLH